MHTLLQLVGYEPTSLRIPKITFGWSWEDRAYGYTRAFAELGLTALVIGPLFVEFDVGI
jgi:hypothetical protein